MPTRPPIIRAWVFFRWWFNAFGHKPSDRMTNEQPVINGRWVDGRLSTLPEIKLSDLMRDQTARARRTDLLKFNLKLRRFPFIDCAVKQITINKGCVLANCY